MKKRYEVKFVSRGGVKIMFILACSQSLLEVLKLVTMLKANHTLWYSNGALM